MGKKKKEKVVDKAYKKVSDKSKQPVKASGEVLKGVKSPKLNWVEQVKQFLREVKVELKKVTWPSKREMIGSTFVVIIFVVLVAAYFGIIDLIYTIIIGKLLG
ncbi:MAG: preprotein translocase subunit SecE [Candidatus Desulfofervidaceae bacterium]|nr:preprotein translocase subunit SecE [Candidatus Desulfofervidaceae bacterium]MDL1970890.1 preprotein translocase subunit SecE [Candidatus Desulfofervidaceae bacterium]